MGAVLLFVAALLALPLWAGLAIRRENDRMDRILREELDPRRR